MKYGKKAAALLLVLAMLLCLSACGSFETKMARSLQKMSQLDSLRADTVLDLDLSMSILGMLSLMTARNDLRLSERAAEVLQAVYQLEGQAEESRLELLELARGLGEDNRSAEELRSSLGEVLSEKYLLSGDVISWEETDGTRMISCAVRLDSAGGNVRMDWQRHNLSSAIAEEEEWFE